MTLTIPGTVCWPVHRVAMSDRYSDGLSTIEREWSLEMVCDACDILDAYDDALADAEKG